MTIVHLIIPRNSFPKVSLKMATRKKFALVDEMHLSTTSIYIYLAVEQCSYSRYLLLSSGDLPTDLTP